MIWARCTLVNSRCWILMVPLAISLGQGIHYHLYTNLISFIVFAFFSLFFIFVSVAILSHCWFSFGHFFIAAEIQSWGNIIWAPTILNNLQKTLSVIFICIRWKHLKKLDTLAFAYFLKDLPYYCKTAIRFIEQDLMEPGWKWIYSIFSSFKGSLHPLMVLMLTTFGTRVNVMSFKGHR